MFTDEITGTFSQNEQIIGQVKIGVKNDQIYLGDVISTHGKHNKGLGTIIQIMVFGKCYF